MSPPGIPRLAAGLSLLPWLQCYSLPFTEVFCLPCTLYNSYHHAIGNNLYLAVLVAFRGFNAKKCVHCAPTTWAMYWSAGKRGPIGNFLTGLVQATCLLPCHSCLLSHSGRIRENQCLLNSSLCLFWGKDQPVGALLSSLQFQLVSIARPDCGLF